MKEEKEGEEDGEIWDNYSQNAEKYENVSVML